MSDTLATSRPDAPPAAAVDIVTLGCRLNGAESDSMRAHAADAGLTNAVIINTCAVTGEAVRQARGEAHPAVQVKNADLVLAPGTGGLLGSRHGGATLILERE